MSRRRTRVTRTRGRIEKLLLLAGLAGIAIWLGSIARTSISQDWANWSFDRKLHGQPVTVSEYLKDRLGPRTGTKPPVAEEHPPAPAEKPPAAKPPALKTGDMIGRLSVPRLNVEAVVREGSNASTLDLALGHIPGTAIPGQAGNVGVAGHRDTLFRGLRNIRKNDRIEFETLNGTYAYEVESTRIVKPKNVSVLDPGKSPELTLVTCYPFYYVGSAPDRFIVKARLVEQNAAAQKPATQNAPQTAQIAPKITQAALTPEPVTPEAVKPAHPARQAPKLVKPARMTERRRPAQSGRRVFFHISDGHSQALAPGISLGLDWSDATSKRLHGWMWVMPDRRTIWLTGENAREPVVFYGHDDGKRREIVITGFGRNSVSGYLQLPPG